MQPKLNFLWLAFFLFCGQAHAEAKAEPQRIQFDAGATTQTVSGSISGRLEHDYIFWARAGQAVHIRINSTPKGNFTAFRLISPSGSPPFASDYDINYDYSFTAPYTGDYLLYVVFRPAGSVTSAGYSLSVTIK